MSWTIKCPRCGSRFWKQVWVRTRYKEHKGWFGKVKEYLCQKARGAAWRCDNCNYWDGDIRLRKES